VAPAGVSPVGATDRREAGGRKRAPGTRVPVATLQTPNQRWSLDYALDVLVDRRRFRLLVVVDDFSRGSAWRR
jgi:putative transposase